MVWNPFSGISGLLSSTNETDDKQIDPRYGIPKADVRSAQMGLLGNVGATLLAAGQRLPPAQRAQLLAQLGPQTAQFSTDIYNAAQRRYQQGMLEEAKAKREFEQAQAAAEEKRKAGEPARMAGAAATVAAMSQPTYQATKYEGETPVEWGEVEPAYSPQDQYLELVRGGFSPTAAEVFMKVGAPPAGDYDTINTSNGIFVVNKATGRVSPATTAQGGLLQPPPKRADINVAVDPNGGRTFTNVDTGESLYVPTGETPDPKRWALFTGGKPPDGEQPQPQPQPAQTTRRTVTDAQIMEASKPFVGLGAAVLGGLEGTLGQAATAAGRQGELNPAVGAGARYLNSVANAARRAFSGAGREGVQELKWAQDILNLPDSTLKRVFSNPASVGNSIIAAAKYAEDGIARIDAKLKTRGLAPSVYADLQKEQIALQDLLAAINSIPGTPRAGSPSVDSIMSKAINPAREPT
jgi:hypothetical protein